MPKIHYCDSMKTACGFWGSDVAVTSDWSDVTCQKCLSFRPEEQAGHPATLYQYSLDEEQVKELVAQYARESVAETPIKEPLAIIYRTFRDGRQTTECLPLWFAQMTVDAIPVNEPDVARARLVTLSAM